MITWYKHMFMLVVVVALSSLRGIYGSAPPSGAPNVQMSNIDMTVKGTITFDDNRTGKLPRSSCVDIKIEDDSLTDTASFVLASKKLDKVSDINLKNGIAYSIVTKKPADNELSRSYVISVTVNVGWCPAPKSDEWIRKGDYLTQTRYGLALTKGSLSYTKDIEVECYGTCEPDEVADNKGGSIKLSNKIISMSGKIRMPTGINSPIPFPLPRGSCVSVELVDQSLADAPAEILDKEHYFDVAGKNLRDGIPYKLTFKKPMDSEMFRSFAVSVVINVGWCRDFGAGESEWLRRGDYKTTCPVNLKKVNGDFVKDVTVRQYMPARPKTTQEPTKKKDTFLLAGPNYRHIGCYRDTQMHAIGGDIEIFHRDAIRLCFLKARRLNNKYFAVQFHVQCFTSRNAGYTFYKYGNARNCAKDGTGGFWSFDLYEVQAAQQKRWVIASSPSSTAVIIAVVVIIIGGFILFTIAKMCSHYKNRVRSAPRTRPRPTPARVVAQVQQHVPETNVYTLPKGSKPPMYADVYPDGYPVIPPPMDDTPPPVYETVIPNDYVIPSAGGGVVSFSNGAYALPPVIPYPPQQPTTNNEA